jgi:hypothetical protein
VVDSSLMVCNVLRRFCFWARLGDCALEGSALPGFICKGIALEWVCFLWRWHCFEDKAVLDQDARCKLQAVWLTW